jgi:hypothetical protein
MRQQITLSADIGFMKLAAAAMCSSQIWYRAVIPCGLSIMIKGHPSTLMD